MSQKTLFQRIRKLEPAQQAVLAAYLCERLLPNYNLFSEHVGFGDPKILRGLLNLVWDKISVNKGGDWERWQEKLEAVTPSDNDFDMLGVYPAIATCTALSCLAQGIADKESAPFLDVAKISQGSVSHYLELGEFADVDDPKKRYECIEEHELMAYEMATQEAMVEFLESSANVDKALVSDVRKIAREEGHSNLGLS
ncbi:MULTISPECIES: YjaG family protein [Gammaproteobacteria]|uniref:YjaG family protein n=1 Tax=Gammaproteobacteria TaxID=1236 RepID=UPI000DD030CA|nr:MULTISPECIES: YjaG family protein [Gammaproteobacteria]RTE86520.1 DUF416 family protein [Aliidiomarina sp. B3213]TCZ90925.1 DUF416 family protein [Lysobacter sp. N42]